MIVGVVVAPVGALVAVTVPVTVGALVALRYLVGANDI